MGLLLRTLTLLLVFGVPVVWTDLASAAPCPKGRLAQELETAKVPAPRQPLKGDSFKVLGIVPGQYGGQRRLLQKKVWRDWDTLFPARADRQGSPQWYSEVLGPEGGHFFGIELLPQNQATLSDIHEISGAIRLYNEGSIARGIAPLPADSAARIGIGFYSEPRCQTPLRQYVGRFGREGVHPVSEGGVLEAHDIDFHVLGDIVMPNRFTVHARLQDKALADFEEFLARRHPETSQAREIQWFLDHAYTRMSKRVDLGYGNVVHNLQRAIQINSTSPLRYGIMGLVENGASPAAVLKKLVSEFGPPKSQALRDALEEFIQEQSSHDPLFTRSLAPETLTEEAVYKEVLDRVAALKERVAEVRH